MRYFLLICLLWGCQYPPASNVSFQSRQALFEAADEANWHLIYQFAYTQSLSTYAKSLGWRPPLVSPICRSVPWPELKEMPLFKPSGNPRVFEQDLTDYIKSLRLQYNQGRGDLQTYAGLQSYMCVY